MRYLVNTAEYTISQAIDEAANEPIGQRLADHIEQVLLANELWIARHMRAVHRSYDSREKSDGGMQFSYREVEMKDCIGKLRDALPVNVVVEPCIKYRHNTVLFGLNVVEYPADAPELHTFLWLVGEEYAWKSEKSDNIEPIELLEKLLLDNRDKYLIQPDKVTSLAKATVAAERALTGVLADAFPGQYRRNTVILATKTPFHRLAHYRVSVKINNTHFSFKGVRYAEPFAVVTLLCDENFMGSPAESTPIHRVRFSLCAAPVVRRPQSTSN